MGQLELGTVPKKLGELPDRMLAYTVRPDREGEPIEAMQREEVEVPQVGPDDVLILVMSAGFNYNGIWSARGQPVSVFRFHEQPYHVGGSDCAGIVWRVGDKVRRWKPGDHVVVNPGAPCGRCSDCAQDPATCTQPSAWGYEIGTGGFAQFARAKWQQIFPKPPHVSWEEAASYPSGLFPAYRMLVTRCDIKAGQYVLIWGASGTLGVYAIQLCHLYRATPIAVVSTEEREQFVRKLGAELVINRSAFDFSQGPSASRAFGKRIRDLTGGKDPDIVFEHIGRDTFETSVVVAANYGKIVICGATTGPNLQFDVRYLWIRHKQIIGSHIALVDDVDQCNMLVFHRKIHPVVGRVYEFDQIPMVHQLMAQNTAPPGNLVVRVQSAAA